MHNNISVNKNTAPSRAKARLISLFDSGSLSVCGENKSFGVIAGKGRILGREAMAVSQDYTVSGGSVNSENARFVCELIKEATEKRVPFVFINESVGANIGDGVGGLNGYGEIFNAIAAASGSIPLISIVAGTCAGGTAYLSAMCDFVVMNKSTGKMFVTGAKVVKTAIGEQTTNESLGSEQLHSRESGIIHFSGDTDEECISIVKTLLAYLPNNCASLPEKADFLSPSATDISALIPGDPRRTYDIRPLLISVLDKDSFLEVQPSFAQNIVIGFGRIEGNSVGIIANQPEALCGALDYDGACKAARFILICNSFNIPVITFVDTPGFMPGKHQEKSGILRHGAKLLYAYSMAAVPTLTVLVRKAYGGAYIAMNCKGMGACKVLAFPDATPAVLGQTSAQAIGACSDQNGVSMLSQAVDMGAVDEVIQPSILREKLCLFIEQSKITPPQDKKHTNIPL